jgi:hypothetical protein
MIAYELWKINISFDKRKHREVIDAIDAIILSNPIHRLRVLTEEFLNAQNRENNPI